MWAAAANDLAWTDFLASPSMRSGAPGDGLSRKEALQRVLRRARRLHVRLPSRRHSACCPRARGCGMAHDAVQTKRRATYEDLLRVPETKVAEIVDGELVVSPRPASPHAFAATVMLTDLFTAFQGTQPRSGQGGWWMLFAPELHLGDDVLVPDVAAWRCGRMPTLPNVAAFSIAPDWLCEIVSPSSGRHDRVVKMRCYAREGVAAVWVVDPLARTLESLRLEGGRWTVVSSHGGDEVVRVEPFEAVEIQLARWWLPD